MMGRTHKAIGAVAGISLMYYYGHTISEPIVLSMGAFAGAMGSLLPDIDHGGSTVSKHMGMAARIVSALATHRGVTHSLLSIVLLYWVISHADHYRVVGYAFIAGYASHILADMLTKGKVMFLWPISIRFGIPLIKTNSMAEPLVGACLALLLFVIPNKDMVIPLIQNGLEHISQLRF